MAGQVSKGAVGANRKGEAPRRKLGDILADEKKASKDTVAYVSRHGVDGAFIYPPGPIYGASGVQIGTDTGVYLDFRGVGVTDVYTPDSNSEHRRIVERVDEAIKIGMPIVTDIGLERLAPKAARPPFAKWDKTGASAIKVALSILFDEDDHTKNVELVKAAARYEQENQKRKDVLDVLDGLLAVEASESDEFDVEVSVS